MVGVFFRGEIGGRLGGKLVTVIFLLQGGEIVSRLFSRHTISPLCWKGGEIVGRFQRRPTISPPAGPSWEIVGRFSTISPLGGDIVGRLEFYLTISPLFNWLPRTRGWSGSFKSEIIVREFVFFFHLWIRKNEKYWHFFLTKNPKFCFLSSCIFADFNSCIYTEDELIV